MNNISRIVALLGVIALAALVSGPLARAELRSDSRPPAEATAQALAAGPASGASVLTPGLAVAPSDPQVIATLVERHNALRALLALEVAPAHPAQIEALMRQEALRRQLALEAAPTHPAQIEALIQSYQAID